MVWIRMVVKTEKYCKNLKQTLKVGNKIQKQASIVKLKVVECAEGLTQ